MVNFRRCYIKGGSYFFTVTLRNRNSTILIEHIDILREVIAQVKREDPFKIEAIVILPEHFHALWQLPANDTNYSQRLRKIKSYFTTRLKASGIHLSNDKRGEYSLWQRRFWEHTIRNEKDYERHVDYIHYNPVKHGLVKQVHEWPYSSFHQFVKNGLLPSSWGNIENLNTRFQYGE